ncbi:uncharacterized protein FTOL_11600 [Fusarium torulosum]|uniref:Beta-lactamase-related domain-containing protein n=1 Tax=Fusarium torulosum TaxID=33205 RepID=A0AAE8MKB3_9HYPO|nr:uncharacterized protein FTOL_11600 [Fusarium torulosum]
MLQFRDLIASLTIGLFTLMSVTAPANVRNPLTKEFDNFVTETLDNWKVPGLSITVINGNEVFAEAQTAATLAHLIESGKYPALANGWSTTISSIIHDDFVLQGSWATEHITLDDTISHRTGNAAHNKAYAGVVEGKEAKPKDIIRNLRNLSLIIEPRVKYSYTNAMYTTVSHIIETVTGKWLRDMMKELIWAPLGINSTFFDLQDAIHAANQLASGYYWDKKEGSYREVPFINITQLSGAGAVFSNILDYAQWVKCLLHEALPFSKDMHRDIKSSRMIESTQLDGSNDIITYGLSWNRNLFNGHVVYTHSGGVHAYGAQVYWLPDIRYGIVAFTNTALTLTTVEDILIWKLIQDRLEFPENERLDVESNTELQGVYYSPGYGQITLREEPHPDRSNETILIADRHDITWKYQMRLHHVSGDYWIIYLPLLENSGYIVEFVAGEFKIRSNRKVIRLEVDWVNRAADEIEGKILFKKVG